MGSKSKPCIWCKKPSTAKNGVFFDHEKVFDAWSSHNKIICDYRSRFEGVRERLKWAALDENDDGAHAKCALVWAVHKEDFGERYPPEDVKL